MGAPVWVGGQNIFLGLFLMVHSDHHRVKYFVKLLTSNNTLAILGKSLEPPLSLTPLDPYRGYGG